MAIRIGQSLGNYRVVRQLGSGGMGAVYLAEHPLIGKKVALKVIHKELSENEEVVRRFFNEARAVNQIGHEHIVDISDYGESDEGQPFFVMELLAGRSLAEAIQRERMLPLPRALRIAAQIADALGAAHAAGIVHRDLKPDNVYLVNRGGDPDFVKLLDFGLAKLVDSGNRALTKAGVVLGTPQYMSPEQCESRPAIDARSDVYALGVLLYHMIAGRVPFDGRTMADILVAHLSQPPPPLAGVPPEVAAIVMRCLEKAPDDRYPSMLALRDALTSVDVAPRPSAAEERRARLAGPEPVVPALAVRRRARAAAPLPLPAIVGGLLGLVAAIAVAGVLLRRPAPREGPIVVRASPRAAAPPPVVERLVATVRLTTDPPGAEIVDEATGALLGTTPAKLEVARDRDLAVVLRLDGYEDKAQTLRASNDVDVSVELVKRPRPRPRPQPQPQPRDDGELLAPR